MKIKNKNIQWTEKLVKLIPSLASIQISSATTSHPNCFNPLYAGTKNASCKTIRETNIPQNFHLDYVWFNLS